MPRDIQLTPTACLVWLLDDGSSTSKRITFNTHSFFKNDVDFLVHKLKQLGFYVRSVKHSLKDAPDPVTYKERYWIIKIGRKKNIEDFFQYCKKGDSRLVKIVERYYPHKFEV